MITRHRLRPEAAARPHSSAGACSAPRPRGRSTSCPATRRVGAGASGTEVASAFGRLGTEVTLFEALPQILPLEDEDIARRRAREIGKQNVEIVRVTLSESLAPSCEATWSSAASGTPQTVGRVR